MNSIFRNVHQKSMFYWLLAFLLGALAGYLYYLLIGCNGSCLISSNPWRSGFYGAMMGLLFRWSMIRN